MVEHRIIDANLNRLAEGLRVIEDICRFGLDDAPLAARLKRLRHEAGRLRRLFPARVLDARDSIGDVGRVKVKEPARREGLTLTLGASFGRVQESLRVLEELAKLSSGATAALAKSMRYEAYELERLVMPLFDRRERAALLRGLYLVMSDPAVGYEKLAEVAVVRKVGAIQLRAKTLEGRELLALARRLREITAGSRTLLIINDRADIARLAEADGVHLGQHDISVAEARMIVGPRALVGKSTHNRRELRRALAEAPDYIGIGPVFGTRSKANPDPTVGLEQAGALLGRASLPAVAIGGIEESNLAALLEAGFACYALIAHVCQAGDPDRVIRRLQKIERARQAACRAD